MASSPPSQVITPLSKPPATDSTQKSVFLAGTTSKGDWRKGLTESISHLPVTIFNPFRPDWDSTWREDISDTKFREQTQWELEMQERADIIIVYFEAGTEAHISLLELGLCARSGKVIVACPEGYKKRGNVQVVCSRFGIPLLESYEALRDELIRRLEN
ncbi:hypothetical protein CkaCkLH20_01752 [Colletotrichum karsti]|uniref:Nucleoside 2-deoxyribosyltransferase domain-containing protein n=1 Tax=Colletotrichum karsti TaxID=1095194 RepID=A0A9P6LPD3_9PEZI|nr:uncharacterized protein CkaCkLH20_01752 [Colletotrichum karsti]KAF9880710.1 hypothetical protein CkaCkLH20_01752 [Colletotrichum karsti]